LNLSEYCKDLGVNLMDRARKVSIGSILMVMVAIGSNVSMSVYLLPICRLYDISITEGSLIFTIAGIGALVSSLSIGKILDAFGIKKVVATSGVMMFLFFASIAFMELPVVYAASFLLGSASVLAGFASAQVVITWWYAKGSAKVMGFLGVGTGFGGIFIVPAAAWLIENIGVRMAALVHGSFAGLWIILTGIFFLSEHPSHYGLEASGSDDKAQTEAKKITGLVMRDIKVTLPFWLIFSACFLIALAFMGYFNNASAIYQGMGITAIQASLCISIYSIAKMAWGPIYGALADKKGVGIATLVCMMPSAIILVLSPLLKGFAGAAILAVLIAPATVVGMIGTLAFISVFGTRESGTLVGLSHAATSIGGIIGPPLAGFSYDSTGSYITFLVIGGILMLCGTLLTYLSTSRKAIRAVRNKEESVNTIS